MNARYVLSFVIGSKRDLAIFQEAAIKFVIQAAVKLHDGLSNF